MSGNEEQVRRWRWGARGLGQEGKSTDVRWLDINMAGDRGRNANMNRAGAGHMRVPCNKNKINTQ